MKKSPVLVCLILFSAVILFCTSEISRAQSGLDDSAILIEQDSAAVGVLQWFETPREVFDNLDCVALDLLPKSLRFEMLAYYDEGIKKQFLNSLDGICYIDTMTDVYMRVSLTPVSIFEIRMLPYNHGFVAMTLYTVGADGQAPDTQVDFYDAQLNLLDADKFFPMPEIKDYLNLKGLGGKDKKQITDLVAFPTFEFTASPDNEILNGRLTVGEYMTQEDYKILKPYIVPAVRYEWNGKKFKQINIHLTS